MDEAFDWKPSEKLAMSLATDSEAFVVLEALESCRPLPLIMLALFGVWSTTETIDIASLLESEQELADSVNEFRESVSVLCL